MIMTDIMRAIKKHLVTEVPDRLGFCEFDCPKYECTECPQKPHEELARLKASSEGNTTSEAAQTCCRAGEAADSGVKNT
jgi:hypothetical protein